MRQNYVDWLYRQDVRLFFWFNHKLNFSILDYILGILTHLGGAAFTILMTLSAALFAPESWSKAGWEALISLTVSHLIAVGLKRRFKRIRPYLALEQVNTAKRMLKDPSFPSGHTTAIFSVITPFIFITGWFSLFLLVLATLVGMSRVYLGHHYPSDCLVGFFLGTISALIIVLISSVWW